MLYINCLKCQVSPDVSMLFTQSGHLEPYDAIKFFVTNIITDPVLNQKDFLRLSYVFKSLDIESMLIPGLGHLMLCEDLLEGQEQSIHSYLKTLILRLEYVNTNQMACQEVLRLLNTVTMYYFRILTEKGDI